MEQEEETGKTPQALLSEPHLFDDLQGSWSVFEALHRSRGILDGRPQALAWSEILAYLELRGIRDEEERDETVEHVLVLDSAYLEHLNKKG